MPPTAFDSGFTLLLAAGGSDGDPAHRLLTDIGVAIVAATFMGLVSHWLRQPILLGYLLAGAIIGPQVGFGYITESHSIEIISEMGLVLLLFIIGLELNLKQILASGRQLLIGGFGQFPICILLGVGLFGLLGYSIQGENLEGIYLAILCSLSSTAIVVKLLYDKGELDTLPGRITIGILVIQDIYAIFVLAFQPNFASPSAGPIAKAVLGTVGLLVIGFVISRYVLRWVFSSIARNPEMVLAVSVGWCALVAATAQAMGLSKEMGALVAGLSIAAFPYSIHVTAKTLPLRDFFLTLFFVSLGMKIAQPTAAMIGPVALIIGFTILSRFLSVFPLVKLSGAGKRAAFVASLNLAQISEFSLVIASIGVSLKHIREESVGLVIYAMAIMAVMSSYAIRFSHPLYRLFDRLTGGTPAAGGDAAAAAKQHDIVLLGCHRTGWALIDLLARHHPHLIPKLLVIDFNPVTLDELKSRGVDGAFGDISSLENLQHAHIHHAKVIVSTIPDLLLKGVDNLQLVRMCRSIAPHAVLIATGDDDKHEQRLRTEGAGVVIRPNELAGASIADQVAGKLMDQAGKA